MSTANKKKTGIILLAYGSPESPGDVKGYLTHIKGGTPPSEAVFRMILDRYRRVGGKTPLLEITVKQSEALRFLLSKEGKKGIEVYVGMKHWHPFINETVSRMIKDGITEIIAVPLAPHYSRISTGGYRHAVTDALSRLEKPPSLTFIESFHNNQYFIGCIVDQTRVAIAKFTHDFGHFPTVIFTAHSLPQKINSWNDPYQSQLMETASLVAGKLKLKNWQFAFQSAGHTPEPWLGPDILETLLNLKKAKKEYILICPIGFVSDNLEILYDLDIECQKLAGKLDIHLARTILPNAHKLFIKALYDIIARYLS